MCEKGCIGASTARNDDDCHMHNIDLYQQGFAWADKAYAVDSAHLMTNAGVWNCINVSEVSYGIIISHIQSYSMEKHANEVRS